MKFVQNINIKHSEVKFWMENVFGLFSNGVDFYFLWVVRLEEDETAATPPTGPTRTALLIG
jgi:hypothetical protein